MPYIKGVKRPSLAPKPQVQAEVAGELTYQISVLVNDWVQYHGMSFDVGGDVIKALECAKLEFYRRVMAPYEDLKLAENGEVYGAHPAYGPGFGQAGWVPPVGFLGVPHA